MLLATCGEGMDRRKRLKSVFDSVDVDKSGHLSSQEMIAFTTAFFVDNGFEDALQEAEAFSERLMEQIDRDKSGSIEFTGKLLLIYK